MTVPTMLYNEDTITDSKVIMMHLAKHHPQCGLYPEALRTDIDTYINLFYDKFDLMGGFTFKNIMNWGLIHKLFVVKNKLWRSNSKLSKLKHDPEFVNVVAEKMKTKSVQKDTVLNTPWPKITAELQEMLNTMEDILMRNGRPDRDEGFLFGEDYSLADVVATCFCARIHMIAGESMFGPCVTKYWHRMMLRASFKEAKVVCKFEESAMYSQIQSFQQHLVWRVFALMAAMVALAALLWNLEF